MQTHSPTYLNKEEIEKILYDSYESVKDKIFQLFQIDLENWYETEFILIYKLNLNPSDIDNVDYYRIETWIENYKTWLEKEKEAREKEESGKGHTLKNKELMKQSKDMMRNSGLSDINKIGKSSSNLSTFNIPKNLGSDLNSLSRGIKLPKI